MNGKAVRLNYTGINRKAAGLLGSSEQGFHRGKEQR